MGSIIAILAYRDLETSADLDQGYLENQIAIRGDFAADGAIPISESGWNVEHPLITRLHELECLRPARNDLGDAKSGGLTAFHRTIEHRAIGELANVVHSHCIASVRRTPGGWA